MTPEAAGTDDEGAWDAPPPPRGRERDALHLELGAYAGPLDLLLDLVRAGKVDLARLSLLDFAHQFEAAVAAATGRGDVPLARLGDWLVATANLALLRSGLLLPADSREGQEARREAEDLRRRLADHAAVAVLTDWLARRPQLGRDVLARRTPEGAHREGGRKGVADTRRGGTPPPADLTTALLRRSV